VGIPARQPKVSVSKGLVKSARRGLIKTSENRYYA